MIFTQDIGAPGTKGKHCLWHSNKTKISKQNLFVVFMVDLTISEQSMLQQWYATCARPDFLFTG